MAYLGKIIQELETKFDITIIGKHYKRHSIDGAYFLSSTIDPSLIVKENSLFIGTPDTIPDLDISAPLLIISRDSDFISTQHLYVITRLDIIDIFNAIQSIILRSYDLSVKERELLETLQKGYGIERMCEIAYSFLRNPISICTSSFELLAAVPTMNDRKNLDKIQGKFYVKNTSLKDMIEQKVIEHIYDSNTPYITTLRTTTYKWAFRSIRINHSVVGYICVRGSVKDFVEDDMDFIDSLSQMLSIELQKELNFCIQADSHYEYLFIDLLKGHNQRIDYTIGCLKQLGFQDSSSYSLIILENNIAQNNAQSLKKQIERLRSILINSLIIVFEGNLIVLSQINDKDSYAEFTLSKLSTYLTLNKMHALISYPFTTLTQVHSHYLQTLELSAIYKNHVQATNDAPLIFYENFVIEHALFQFVNSELLEASIHPDIQKIVEHDIMACTEYSITLETFLKENRNANAAAKSLHIHKSTFFYRLNKLETLFNIDFSNSNLLFLYEYSFRALEYIGKNQKI